MTYRPTHTHMYTSAFIYISERYSVSQYRALGPFARKLHSIFKNVEQQNNFTEQLLLQKILSKLNYLILIIKALQNLKYLHLVYCKLL